MNVRDVEPLRLDAEDRLADDDVLPERLVRDREAPDRLRFPRDVVRRLDLRLVVLADDLCRPLLDRFVERVARDERDRLDDFRGP